MGIERHGLSIGIERVGAWLVSGEVRYFENRDDTVDWLGD